MRRSVVLAAVVLAGCTQNDPRGTLYLDPTYDLTGSEPPANTLGTMDHVFAGVKFGGSTAPLRSPDEDERLRTGAYRPFGAPAPLPKAEPFVGPPAPPPARAPRPDVEGEGSPAEPDPDPKTSAR